MGPVPPFRLAALAFTLWIGAAASACPPSLPDDPPPPPPPTAEQRARAIAASPNIVYGIVTRYDEDSGTSRFRVVHVYKGSLRPGQVIEAPAGWGPNAPSCTGTSQPPPATRGTYGVIYFNPDYPALNFVADTDLAIMFREGLIQSARAGGPAPH